MQGRLSSADRKLLWGAGLFGVTLVAATLAFSPGAEGEHSPVPSSYSSDPDGALAAYLLLEDLHVSVSRVQEAPGMLADAPDNSVLVLAEPSEEPSSSDRKALLEFVSRGGRILYCGAELEKFLPLSKTPTAFTVEPKTFDAQFPSPFTRDAHTISMRARSRWDAPPSSGLDLYGQDEAVVVAARIGKGEVLWWAAATPLTNVGITSADNLRLFLNAVTNADGTPREVYWDEYFHGQKGSLWSYIEKTPLPWGMWQLGIVAVVVLFAFSRRSGPMMLPRAQSRLSPLEFVETMGDLYDRAGAARIAVDVPYRRLRLQLAQRLGQSATASDADLARGASSRLRLPETEMRDALQAASRATGVRKLPAKQALELVKKLVRYSHQLTIPRSFQEKKT